MPIGNSNLTAGRIKKLAVESDYERREIYASDGGCKYLGVKARGGSVSFLVRKKVSGKIKQFYIGKTDEFSLAEARELTPAVARLMNDGFSNDAISRAIGKTRNPLQLENVIRGNFDHGAEARMTLVEALETWWQYNYEMSDKSERTRPIVPLRRYIVPKLGNRPVDEVTTREFKDVLSPIWTRKGSRGRNAIAGHVTATRMRQNLDDMYEQLVEDGAVDRNPVPRAKSFPRFRHQPKHNDALEDPHLPEFWNWLRNICGADIATKTGIAMCLFLGSRPGQVINLKWSMIDFENAVYNAPATIMRDGVEISYTKTRIQHAQPIPRQLLAMLVSMQEISSNRDWALTCAGKQLSDGTMRKNTRGFKPSSDPDHSGFTPAGFRATLNTWLVNNGCTFETKEVILQHSLPKIPAPYYRDYNLEPRREWLQRYADMVTGAAK